MTSIKKEEVYKDLQEKIITHVLPYGTRLNEKELMEKYEIGRTPLRDIFMKLQAEYLIETVPQSGTFVKELDMKEVKDTLELRVHLEVLAAKKIPLNITTEQLDEMNFIIFNLNKKIDSITLEEFKTLTDRLNNIYYHAIDNTKLRETLMSIFNISSRAWFSMDYEMKPIKESLKNWEKRISYIENKEIEKLQLQVEKHVVDFATLLNLKID